MRSYSRFFHSRVMAVVSGVDRSTLFRGRFIVHSRSEAHAHRPIEIRLACRSRVRADRAHARTHWTARFARVVARDRPRRTQPPPGCKCALNSAQQFCVRDERSHAPVAKGVDILCRTLASLYSGLFVRSDSGSIFNLWRGYNITKF